MLPTCISYSIENHGKYMNIQIGHPWYEMQNASKAENFQVLILSTNVNFTL